MSGASPDRFFHGDIAQVRIWNRALSKDEIVSSYHAQEWLGSTEGLVGWWPLNEGTGTTAVDHSGNGRHGTIHNPAWSEPNKVVIQVTHNPLWVNPDPPIDTSTEQGKELYRVNRRSNPRHIFLGMPTVQSPEGGEIDVEVGDTVEWLFDPADRGEQIINVDSGNTAPVDDEASSHTPGAPVAYASDDEFWGTNLPDVVEQDDLQATVQDTAQDKSYKYLLKINNDEPFPIDPRLTCRRQGNR